MSCSSKRASNISGSLQDSSALSFRTPTDNLNLALDFDLESDELEDVDISGGQLVKNLPSSESSPELAVGPAAVDATLVNCNYTSTKHGLDNNKFIHKNMCIQFFLIKVN